jgi:hypothetical protein
VLAAALTALGMVGVATVAGCAVPGSTPATSSSESFGTAGASTTAPTTTTTTGGTTADAGRPASASEVSALLTRRAAALLAGDEQEFRATVADPRSSSGRRQLDGYDAARALRLARLEVENPTLTGDLATVVVHYRLDGLDTGDRETRLAYRVVRLGDGWAVVSEEPSGPGASAPWVAMPGLRVHRTKHAVVAGTVPQASLVEYAGIVDRARPEMHRHWPGTPNQVLVLAPATAEQADALLGRPRAAESGGVKGSDGAIGSGGVDGSGGAAGPGGAAESGGRLARPGHAARWRPPPRAAGPDGRATGDRIVLDPDAYTRLSAVGRDVVLTHELAHVAVRSSVPGAPATWLAEGYADHVGYARAGLGDGVLLAPLITAVREGRAPTELPDTSALQPTSGNLEVPYLAAWQAVDLIAQEHGEEALRELVRAAASTGTAADAEARTDAALETVLGSSREELTRAWRQRLETLAR